MRTPLLLTRDEPLLDDLLRLAAAAGTTPEVALDAGAALRSWGSASVVIVGLDVAEDLVRLDLPRRPGVHLVDRGRVPDEAFRTAVRVGAESVVELPRTEQWLLETFAEAAEGGVGRGLSVGVLGGSGGSGATTFACALALTAARDGSVCLVDTDPHGPGVDRVLGIEGADGTRWEALQQSTGRMSARSLREALPRRDGVGVLTWSPGAQAPLPLFAVRDALSAAARGHDVVVVDLPRAGFEEELLSRCDRLVVTVRATLPGIAAAARTVARVSQTGPTSVVVRGSAVDPEEVQRAVRAPVLAAMPDQRGLDEAVDLGLGPLRARRGVLARTSATALDALRAGDRAGREAA